MAPVWRFLVEVDGKRFVHQVMHDLPDDEGKQKPNFAGSQVPLAASSLVGTDETGSKDVCVKNNL